MYHITAYYAILQLYITGIINMIFMWYQILSDDSTQISTETFTVDDGKFHGVFIVFFHS